MKEIWTSMASLMGVIAFCQTLISTIFPPELRFAAAKLIARFATYFSSYTYFDITEIDGVSTNELYNSVQLYLSSSATSCCTTATRLSLSRAVNSSSIMYGLSNNDRIVDNFDGVRLQWVHIVTQRQSQTFSWRPIPEEKRGFTLRVTKGAEFLVEKYLDHITQKAGEIRRRNQDRFLYTNPRGGSLDSRGHPWEAVPFKHPSTFDTLAIDPDKKRLIMDDLREFVDGEKFYSKTGRAWKRGYLLFGPPGTGKSSMIAAIANYLGFDIYDLELTEVTSNSELRKLLMKTTSKSIIVIEDIDCSLNLTNRKPGGTAARRSNNHDSPTPDIRTAAGNEESNNNSITLSGLLNFTDGLWSCCGCERIFVFTTNHIDKLDPALLRSGRMDMHIYMSYCSMPALGILLRNYLGLEQGGEEDDVDEAVMKGIEGVIEEAQMTPADISEVLIRNRRDKGKAVRELLEELERRAERKRKRENARSGAGAGAGGGGAFGAKGSMGMVEQEEEQEKRALEILPKMGSDQHDDEIMESCIDAKVDHDHEREHKSN